MNIKKKSFLILLLIISSIFFYVRNYKIKEGKKRNKRNRWGRKMNRVSSRVGGRAARWAAAKARQAARTRQARWAAARAREAARQQQVRVMRRALAAAARRAQRYATAVSRMNNKYSRIQNYCSSNGFDCNSGDYTPSRNIRENQCRKSIRNLKKFCSKNSNIRNETKCKKVKKGNFIE